MTWQTLLAIDFDKWAAETYRANFPGVRVECGPVCDFIDALPAADVVLGGPPCQPHSHAGKRQASKDARDCGPDFVAAVAKVKPRMFLMENVDGLLTSEGGAYFMRLHQALEGAGYVVQHRVQDAVDFGVPQFRVRLWVWGIRHDLYVDGIRHQWPCPTHAWPPPNGQMCMFGAVLLPGVTVGEALGIGGTIQSHADPAQTVHRPSPTLRSGGAGHDGCCIRHKYDHGTCVPERPAVTLKAGGNYDASGKQGGGCPPVLALMRPAPTLVGGSQRSHTNGLSVINDRIWRESFADAPAHTLGAQSREPIQNWKAKGYRRRLTPDECLRLQAGPDSFAWPDKISKTNRYRVIGNGWACGHAAHFSRALAAADPDSRTVIDLFCGGGLGASGWHQKYWTYTPEEGETQCA